MEFVVVLLVIGGVLLHHLGSSADWRFLGLLMEIAGGATLLMWYVMRRD